MNHRGMHSPELLRFESFPSRSRRWGLMGCEISPGETAGCVWRERGSPGAPGIPVLLLLLETSAPFCLQKGSATLKPLQLGQLLQPCMAGHGCMHSPAPSQEQRRQEWEKRGLLSSFSRARDVCVVRKPEGFREIRQTSPEATLWALL